MSIQPMYLNTEAEPKCGGEGGDRERRDGGSSTRSDGEGWGEGRGRWGGRRGEERKGEGRGDMVV